MEPESSKWLPRTSKKKPMSQQRHHRGNRRHLRRQKRSQRGPMERPNNEKQANMNPTGLQKGVRKRSKSKTLEKLKIELPLQREPRPSGPIKLGRSWETQK